jgi:hypothetical protein
VLIKTSVDTGKQKFPANGSFAILTARSEPEASFAVRFVGSPEEENDMSTNSHRLQPDTRESEHKTVAPERKRQDANREEETEPTEQGVELDPKRRID